MRKLFFLLWLFLSGCAEIPIYTRLSLLPTVGPGASPKKRKIGISLSASSAVHPLPDEIRTESVAECKLRCGLTDKLGMSVGLSIKGLEADLRWRLFRSNFLNFVACGGGSYNSDLKPNFFPKGSAHVTIESFDRFKPYVAYRFEEMPAEIIRGSEIKFQGLASGHILALGIEVALSDNIFLRNESNFIWLYHIPVWKEDTIEKTALRGLSRIGASLVIQEF